MPSKDKGLSRRDFIKWSMGAAGLLTVLATPLFSVLRQARAATINSEVPSKSLAEKALAKEKVRSWSMIIDLRGCDGCVGLEIPPQCLQACIQGHYAPADMKWIEIYRQELPGGGSYFMPTPCFHCENAPCVNVCPVAATYHTEEGTVLVDQRRCIGCRFCMAACPYQRRFFNWGDPLQPPEAEFAEYSPETQIPAVKGTVMKCAFCLHLTKHGKLPYCVAACPRKVLYMGDFNEDIATNGVAVVQLSKFLDENNAYRYKEHLGTKPRVWYIPGHGQQVGRKPDDPRELKPPVRPWEDDKYEIRPGITPWREEFYQRPGFWPWRRLK